MALDKKSLQAVLNDNPKKVVSLETNLSPRDHREGHVTIQTFDVHITDPEGKQLGTYPLEIGYPKNQDVVDTIVYSVDKENGDITIYTETSLRPVLTTRESLGVSGDGTDRLIEGLYTIMSPERGDISFTDAIKRVLHQKAGYDLLDDAVIDLQSSYFPSIGGSAEVAIGCYINVSDTQKPESNTVFGERFDAERTIAPVSIHTIINDFVAGKPSDLRIVLHAFALAKKYDISLRLREQSPALLAWAETKNKQIPHGMYEICGNNAEETLQHVLNNQNAYTITLEKNETTPQFMQAKRAEINQTRQDGTQESYNADMMVRNGVDTIDALPYFWSKGKLYVVAKAGVRPTLIGRNHLPHYISLSETLANIELYSGVKNPQQGLNDQVNNLLKKKLGSYELKNEQIGSFFPSSGNNPEKTDFFVCQLDTEQGGEMVGWKEFDCVDTPVLAIELETLFQLYEKNIIKDPRLMLGAYTLQQKYDYTNVIDKPIATIDAKEKHRFQEVINAPLQVDNFYKYIAQKRNDPAIYDRHVLFKEKSPWYRKVMSYVEEELGGFFSPEDMLLSETDKHFFDAAFVMFAVPSEELALKYQNYAAHDMGHYVQGTIVPRPDMPKETYVRLMSKTESYAVYDSDYRYPKELGLDLFEPTIGNNKSLARSFDNLGITDPDEARRIVTQIEVDGVIPEKILRHPNYEAERQNIVWRIYRFHFLDKAHAEHQYDQWMKNQKIADVLLRFGNCTDSVEEFEKRIDQYDKKTVKNHGEGVNPLKSFLKRITTQDIQMLAMKAAVMLQMFHNNGLEESHPQVLYIHQLLDQLEHYKNMINAMHAAVTGIEMNEKNVQYVRDADAIKAQIEKLTAVLMNDFMKRDCLSLDQKDILQKNTVPYFTGFIDIPKDQLDKMIEEGERKQIEALG